MKVVLRRHQMQNLHFMLRRESRPAWRDFWFPVAARGHGGMHGGIPLLYSPIWNTFVSTLPPDTRGGWLADEMGLGKTVSMLALMSASPRSVASAAGGGGTLVVCPVSLLHQWKREIEQKTRMRACIYHGPNRQWDRLRGADVVVTSSSIIGAEFGRAQRSSGTPPLAAVRWHRIVVDESHTLKSSETQQMQGLMELRAKRRWCVSGTPLAEYSLFAQARFLRLPLGDPRKPLLAGNAWATTARTAYRAAFGPAPARSSSDWRLQYALNLTMMRHFKAQRLGGFPVIVVPRLREETVRVALSAAERAEYEAVQARAARILLV